MTSAASRHFLDVASGLAPQIRAAVDEIERMRRLPLPLVQGMAQACSAWRFHGRWVARKPTR